MKAFLFLVQKPVDPEFADVLLVVDEGETPADKATAEPERLSSQPGEGDRHDPEETLPPRLHRSRR